MKGALKIGMLLVVALMAAAGCGGSSINDSSVVADDADIPDSEEYRDIVTLVETYRQAIEDKDVGTLRRLVSSDYYENGSSNDRTDDDYGYDGLTANLELFAEYLRQVRLSVVIHEIELEGDRANVYIDYSFNILYVVGGQERWHVDNDVDRIELVREGSSWRIIAGL